MESPLLHQNSTIKPVMAGQPTTSPPLNHIFTLSLYLTHRYRTLTARPCRRSYRTHPLQRERRRNGRLWKANGRHPHRHRSVGRLRRKKIPVSAAFDPVVDQSDLLVLQVHMNEARFADDRSFIASTTHASELPGRSPSFSLFSHRLLFPFFRFSFLFVAL